MFELKLKHLNFLKDKNELVELTKQAVKFHRFVLEKDVDLYATKFFLENYKNSSIALGAYINNELKGFILFSSLKEEAINKDFPKELYEIVKKKFADYNYLEDTNVYRKTCDNIIKRVATGADGEITLFVVNKNERGSGIGRKLFTECLKIIENNHYQKIFLTSDSECNYTYYLKFGFKIVGEDFVFYKNDKVQVYIEVKEI